MRFVHRSVPPLTSIVLQFGVVGYDGPWMQIENVVAPTSVPDAPLRITLFVTSSDPGSVGDSVFLIVPTQDVGTVSVRLAGDTVQPVPGCGLSTTL